MKRQSFQIMLVLFVGTNYDPFRLDIISYDDTEFGGEELNCIKILRQFESGISKFYLLQPVEPIYPYLVAVVAPENVPTVLKQFDTIWLNGKAVAMFSIKGW